MPVNLMPRFCLFNPSLPNSRLPSAMKLGPSHLPTQVLPVFSRIFPFKVNYLGLRSSTFHKEQLAVRRLSSHVGSGLSYRSEVRASKSLIDDEAELSDWVTELRTDSFRGRMASDDDDRDANASRSRNPDKGRDSYSTRKRRDSDDEFNQGRRSGGARGGSVSSFTGNRGGRGQRTGAGERNGGNYFVSGYGRDGGRSGGKDFGSGYGQGGGRGRSDFNSRSGRDSGGSEGLRRNRNDSSSRFGQDRGASVGSGRQDGGMSAGKDFGSGYGQGGGRGRGRNDLSSRYGSEGLRRDRKDSSSLFGLDRGASVGSRRGRNNLSPGHEQDRRGSRGLSRGGKDMGSAYGQEQGASFGLKRGGKAPRREALLDESGDDEEEEERRSLMSDVDEDEMKSLMGGIGNFLIDEDSEIDDDEGDDTDALNNSSSLIGAEKIIKPQITKSSPGKSDSYLTETRFDQCSISALTLKGIKDAGYEKMTVVQEATLPVILKGKDVLAKAKTGTGKTVAFLLPAIEVIAKSPPASRDERRPPILVLVICPTRELASQAAAEANSLLKYHPSTGVQVVIGGTRLTMEQKRMQANPCQILVATPGRLKDHIENTAGFATRLMGVKVLVLDEADHLLDMGFRRDIERIIAAVPKQRQTLLFSATVPEEVRQICHIALKRDHEFINTVQEGSEETHTQVRQTHMIAPLDKHFPILYSLLKDHISDDVDYKVLVFCTTAMVTRLVANLLSELKLNVREIHSRKPQSYRTRVSDEFRKSNGIILVTSDVSARGVDYPDVTLVIQVGLPSDREQYIHRLGRTGRKGKEGQGILLLAPWEEYFLGTIKDLPTSMAPEPLVDPDTKKKVERALSQIEMKNKEAAYQAWLGYYNSVKNVGRDKHRLVELANEFSQCMGLDSPPVISKVVLGKMGLKNVPGLRSK